MSEQAANPATFLSSALAPESPNGEAKKLQLPKVLSTDDSLIALPAGSVPFGVSLPCSIYLKVAGRYVLFREQGEVITNQRAAELQRSGVGAMYIHKVLWKAFLKELEIMELPQPATPEVQALRVRTIIVAFGKELERSMREERKPLFDKLRKLAYVLAERLDEDPRVAEKLLQRSTESSMYFLNHLVNAAVYSNLIARKLGLSSPDRKELTYSVLVHNAGNLALPRRILLKAGQLSEGELQQLREHPRNGAELLVSIGAPPAIVQTAFQHHERLDGTGYPQGLKGNQISLFARICSIADVFDALISHRPYRAALHPAAALETMQKMKGVFDPAILATVSR